MTYLKRGPFINPENEDINSEIISKGKKGHQLE